MQNKSWPIFLGMGILIILQAVVSLIKIPVFFDAGDLAWLTNDPDVVDYVIWQVRVLGVWQFGFGLMAVVTAVTGYRQGQSYAWWGMWCAPLLLLGVTAVMPWLLPITVVLILIAMVVQFRSRHIFFRGET